MKARTRGISVGTTIDIQHSRNLFDVNQIAGFEGSLAAINGFLVFTLLFDRLGARSEGHRLGVLERRSATSLTRPTVMQF